MNVAAGAVVTKDVPPEHVVTGVNTSSPAKEWRGRRLQDLIRHWQTLAAWHRLVTTAAEPTVIWRRPD